MSIKIFDNAVDTCRGLADLLVKMSVNSCSVALSGGSTPKLLFTIIKEQYGDIDWSNIKFFWSDERLVPAESSESNFGEFSRILIDSGVISRENVFQIEFSGDKDISLQDIEGKIRREVKFKNGLPNFDLIILGVGEDGHIASIFPDNLVSFESTEMVEAVLHPQSKQSRISLCGSVINNAENVAILCTGEHKKEILDQIINKKDMSFPASFVSPNQEVIWFLDNAAAEKLIK